MEEQYSLSFFFYRLFSSGLSIRGLYITNGVHAPLGNYSIIDHHEIAHGHSKVIVGYEFYQPRLPWKNTKINLMEKNCKLHTFGIHGSLSSLMRN